MHLYRKCSQGIQKSKMLVIIVEKQSKAKTGLVDSTNRATLGYSICNPYNLYGKFWNSYTEGVDNPLDTSTQNSYTLCGRFN